MKREFGEDIIEVKTSTDKCNNPRNHKASPNNNILKKEVKMDKLTERLGLLLLDRYRELMQEVNIHRNNNSMLEYKIEHYNQSIETYIRETGTDNFNGQKLCRINAFSDEIYNKLAKIKVIHKGEEVPFFSETFLYDVIGKEDARTVMALMGQIFSKAGQPNPF
jgi:hypothetical protein